MADYRILIADYEPRGIEQLRAPLEQAGYDVEVVKDGLSAIAVFQDKKPHLTLLEAMLPKKHGFEVCQELKSTVHGKASPVVIVTSVYKGRKYRTQALHHYGCDEYLEKPVVAAELVALVQRLIAASSFAAEEPAAASPTPVAAEPARAASPAEAAAPAASEPDADDAEFEIMERLNQIIPTDPGSGGPKAQVGPGRLIDLEGARAARRPVLDTPGPQTSSKAPIAVNGGVAPAVESRPRVGRLSNPKAGPRPRSVPPRPRPPTGATGIPLRIVVLVAVLSAMLLLLIFGPF